MLYLRKTTRRREGGFAVGLTERFRWLTTHAQRTQRVLGGSPVAYHVSGSRGCCGNDHQRDRSQKEWWSGLVVQAAAENVFKMVAAVDEYARVRVTDAKT